MNPELDEDETQPPLLKLHIAGHGTSIGNVDDDESKEEYIKAREQDILTKRRRLSDYEEKLANQSDTEFLQITNETCLSGNALAQMIGIPLNEPYSNFDYAMYSTDNPDGNQDFPKARDINEMILDSGRTARSGLIHWAYKCYISQKRSITLLAKKCIRKYDGRHAR